MQTKEAAAAPEPEFVRHKSSTLRDDIVLPSTPVKKVQAYNLSVITGKEEGAGTDANVYVTVFGTDEVMSRRKLNEDPFNFEQVFPGTICPRTHCCKGPHRRLCA